MLEAWIGACVSVHVVWVFKDPHLWVMSIQLQRPGLPCPPICLRVGTFWCCSFLHLLYLAEWRSTVPGQRSCMVTQTEGAYYI